MAVPDYTTRTDSVEIKLEELRNACLAKSWHAALSLAESVKDTIKLGWQADPEPGEVVSRAEHFLKVAELPGPWAKWAAGWSFCKPLALFETVGIARAQEPVDFAIEFDAAQLGDPRREVRVARVDAAGALEAIPCQVYGEVRRGEKWNCHLVVAASVPAHERASLFVFYGNPHAELPEYETDLSVRGEGFGLDIENRYYVAQLSRQMGQLDRLRYKHGNGLELFAGGKGHGEPPTIDWTGDYVDHGNFQKLRVKNWAEPPNWHVVRGPLCVRVQRWGFPHSPLHPVYAPSRIHIDQTYVFYAGQPYFRKFSQFDVFKGLLIEAMRDDEWVFSGYSFTDALWLDAQGKVKDGLPTSDDQTGVGFYHRQSRDAFIALWLQHTGQGKDLGPIRHAGDVSLHYPGHGQLWTRYPLRKERLRNGDSFHQHSAYLTGTFASEGGAEQVERLRHALVNPLEIKAEELPAIEARTKGALARPGETSATGTLKTAIWEALRTVRDEQLYEIDANIVDLGYVYDVRVRDGAVRVLVTMPHRGRPVHEYLVTQGGGRREEGIQERLLKIPGVTDVVVEQTWDPPWTASRISDKLRKEMGLEST